MNSNKVELLIVEQSKLLSESSKVAVTLLNNLVDLLNGIVTACSDFAQQKNQIEKDFDKFVQLTQSLADFTEELPALASRIIESEKQMKELHNQANAYDAELNKYKELLDDSNAKHKELEDYFTNMGAVVATMVWKTSKSEEAIEIFIQENLEEFLVVAEVGLKSFFSSFPEQLPSTDSYIHKFVMSIYGILGNVSAAECGRRFILESKSGLTITNSVLEQLKLVKSEDGLIMRRMMLMYLYNLSISRRGSLLIQKTSNGIANIMNCFKPENSIEIKTLALNVMNNLLGEFPTKEFYNIVKKMTSLEDLQQIMYLKDKVLMEQCKKFHSTLSKQI